jgi:thermitase
VVAVGSTDFDDEYAGHAIGPELDLVAPGEGVYSATVIEDGSDSYGTLAGTSMATPCAAGVAALVRSANPNLTAEETLEVLLENCDKVWQDGGDQSDRSNEYGHGRVNAAKAVAKAVSLLP